MKVEIDATLGAVGVVGGGTGDTATATSSGDVEAYIGAAKGSTPTAASTVIDVTNAVYGRGVSPGPRVRDGVANGGSGSVLIAVTLKTAEATSRARLARTSAISARRTPRRRRRSTPGR